MLKNLDPRARLIAITSVTFVAVFVRDVIVLSGAFALSVIFAAVLGVNVIRLMIKLRRFIVIIAAAAILQSVFARAGAVLLEVGGFTLLTSGGISGGALILLRMGILMCGGAAVATCGIRKNIQALIQMRLPYEIAFMVCVGIHFIPLISREMQDSLIAVQLRGVDLKNIPIRRRIRVYTYILLPAVGSAIIKAQDLAASIELRGFRAYERRTSLTVLHMRALDYAISAVFVGAGGATMWLYYFC